MSEALQQLMTFDVGQVVVSICLVLVIIGEGKKIIISALDALGLETKASKQKKACECRIGKLEEHDKWQYEQIKNISQGIEDIKSIISVNEKEEDMRRIKDLKSEILAFSRSLKRFEADGIEESSFTEEDYDKIYESYGEYEDLLTKHKMENGKTARAMRTINAHSERRGFGSIDI